MEKTARIIAQFSHEMMCRNGCFEIQINDEDREFVGKLYDELHFLTGVQQRVTSVYHHKPQSLVEVLEEDPLKLSSIIVGVLFAHCVSKQSSTKYSPSSYYTIENQYQGQV